jgi:hypothetical protein
MSDDYITSWCIFDMRPRKSVFQAAFIGIFWALWILACVFVVVAGGIGLLSGLLSL